MKSTKQKTIHTSFDKDSEDLYFKLMSESTAKMVPIAALSRYYMRVGMETGKKPTLIWVSPMKNLQIPDVDYEMLLVISKAKRKKPVEVVSEFLKSTYMNLKG